MGKKGFYHGDFHHWLAGGLVLMMILITATACSKSEEGKGVKRLKWGIESTRYPSVIVRTEVKNSHIKKLDDAHKVSRLLEKEFIEDLTDLENISSISHADLSELFLYFKTGTDINTVIKAVQKIMDQNFIPDMMKKSEIIRYNPELHPTVTMGITSGRTGLDSARKLAEDIIKVQLGKIQGITAIKVIGGLKEAVLINFDQKKMRLFGLNLKTIIHRLAENKLILMGNTSKIEGYAEYVVQKADRFNNLDEILQIIIQRINDVPFRVKDIASVNRGFIRPDFIVRINGLEGVILQIYKAAALKTDDIIHRVYKQAQIFKKQNVDYKLPEYLHIKIISSPSPQSLP